MSKRSQYAMEYLMVISFSLLIVLPIIALLLSGYSDMNYTMSAHQVYSIADKVADSAMNVYYLGEGSMIKMYVSIPNDVVSSGIENNEILFKVRATQDSYTDVYKISKVDVIGDLPTTPGNHKIIIESRGDHVWIGT